MAHYAKLGINSKVIAVIVVADSDCQNADGIEDEEVGRQFLERIYNYPLWKKTSYNTTGSQHKLGGTPLRGNYAAVGMTYDTSWVLNVSEARWQSPIGDQPNLTAEQTSQNEANTHQWTYEWNELEQSWDITNSKN